jgi:hypothetical protein
MKTRIGLLAFPLLLGSAALLLSQSSNVPSHTQIEQDRRERYARLSDQIYSYEAPESQRLHLTDKDQIAMVVGKLQDVVRDRIVSVLASGNPTATAVTDAIKRLQGERAMSAWGNDATNTPYADFSDVKGSHILSVGYSILRGGAGIPDSLPVLEFYKLTNTKWELQATAPAELTASTLYIHRMDAALAGEAWYLVWGNRLGDTGTRLRIRLYAFDGSTVRTVWKRDDLSHGTMDEISTKSITFSFERVYNSGQRTYETLYVTPSGLE